MSWEKKAKAVLLYVDVPTKFCTPKQYYCSENVASHIAAKEGVAITPDELNQHGCVHFDSCEPFLSQFGYKKKNSNFQEIITALKKNVAVPVSTIPDGNWIGIYRDNDRHSFIVNGIGYDEAGQFGVFIVDSTHTGCTPKHLPYKTFLRWWNRTKNLAMIKP